MRACVHIAALLLAVTSCCQLLRAQGKSQLPQLCIELPFPHPRFLRAWKKVRGKLAEITRILGLTALGLLFEATHADAADRSPGLSVAPPTSNFPHAYH